jgi:hypothetical protein
MKPGRLLVRATAIDVAATMRHLDRQGLKGRQAQPIECTSRGSIQRARSLVHSLQSC